MFNKKNENFHRIKAKMLIKIKMVRKQQHKYSFITKTVITRKNIYSKKQKGLNALFKY